MGALHAGHLSLVDRARKECDIVFVSIFVNPKQFGPKEDFSKYPRDIEKDSKMLEGLNVDYIFFPDAAEIYPDNYLSYIDVEKMTEKQEGEYREGHFKGVTTVVGILFNCVQPDRAYFGQKDAQQVTIIKKMVSDLKYDTQIVVCPTVRETDGLAMSSRNVYLKPEEREKALLLSKSLALGKGILESGELKTSTIIKKMNELFLTEKTVSVNYIRIVSADLFEEIEYMEKGKEYYFLIACRVGSTRLIDNYLVTA